MILPTPKAPPPVDPLANPPDLELPAYQPPVEQPVSKPPPPPPRSNTLFKLIWAPLVLAIVSLIISLIADLGGSSFYSTPAVAGSTIIYIATILILAHIRGLKSTKSPSPITSIPGLVFAYLIVFLWLVSAAVIITRIVLSSLEIAFYYIDQPTQGLIIGTAVTNILQAGLLLAIAIIATVMRRNGLVPARV